VVGVIMAGLSALSAFAVIPIHPVWGVMIAAVAIAVIWALTAHGRDVADL
jgi:NADH:ubiquinone oxidoreductase subunit H